MEDRERHPIAGGVPSMAVKKTRLQFAILAKSKLDLGHPDDGAFGWSILHQLVVVRSAGVSDQ